MIVKILMIPLLWFILFFIVTVWIASDLNVKGLPSMSLQNLANFGDSFNVLTSLFAGLAFAALYYSINMQLKEFYEQKQILRNQEFDNKFFQMMGMLNNIKSQLKIDRFQGIGVFNILHKKLTSEIKQRQEEDINWEGTNVENKIVYFQECFTEFNADYDTSFKYYFLNLFQVFKYIDDACEDDKKKFYANIIRAQLSKDELILLAYNAIGVQNFTSNKYQQYVEKYALLEHLSYSDFAEDNSDIQEIVACVLSKYSTEAFGDNNQFVDDLNEVVNSRVECQPIFVKVS